MFKKQICAAIKIQNINLENGIKKGLKLLTQQIHLKLSLNTIQVP